MVRRQRRTSRSASSARSAVPLGAVGGDMRDAAELALDKLGRKMGGRPVTIIYEDDQLKPESASRRPTSCIESDHV